MNLIHTIATGLGAGALVGACGLLGEAKQAADVAFTAAEAACVQKNASKGAAEARKACGVEDARASGVELLVVEAVCSSDAGQTVPVVLAPR